MLVGEGWLYWCRGNAGEAVEGFGLTKVDLEGKWCADKGVLEEESLRANWGVLRGGLFC
ncbi:hypothetical protein [Bartonella schoenbuchensis]|uniref:hypothetical protein n=1 Tax=Bartonella schoenbuchensis TaxID=165694 RepID=UPI0031451888